MKNKNMKISFRLDEMPCYAIAHKGGRKTFEMQAFSNRITCAVQYDFEFRPLSLNTTVKKDDFVEIILMPHRIELYVNGELRDEDWPAGNRLLEKGDEIISMPVLQVEDYIEPQNEVPSVISAFTNAEGWRPEENVFVGDCMPYAKDGEYHVLYLKDRRHHGSKWSLGAHQWEHISTKDFSQWFVHPTAVPITDPSEGSICTGSWVRHEGKEYLYYSIRKWGDQPAPICRSISTDGYHFEKDTNFGFTLPEGYHLGSARDPKVIRDGCGIYHMFVTTTSLSIGRGCLAHLVSEDFEHWRDYGEPIYVVSDDISQPECPDYFYYKNHYYLIFSIGGKGHYLYSKSPFDGWIKPENDIIPCSSVPKCAVWGDKIIFAGFARIAGYAGNMTFKSATADENGELIFS